MYVNMHSKFQHARQKKVHVNIQFNACQHAFFSNMHVEEKLHVNIQPLFLMGEKDKSKTKVRPSDTPPAPPAPAPAPTPGSQGRGGPLTYSRLLVSLNPKP